MKTVKRFYDMPMDAVEAWEKKTDSIVFIDAFKEDEMVFQKNTFHDGDPALVVMLGDEVFSLDTAMINRLKEFLNNW